MLLRMPELPDIAAYISALEPRIVGRALERVRLGNAFLLRTVEPGIGEVEGRVVALNPGAFKPGFVGGPLGGGGWGRFFFWQMGARGLGGGGGGGGRGVR